MEHQNLITLDTVHIFIIFIFFPITNKTMDLLSLLFIILLPLYLYIFFFYLHHSRSPIPSGKPVIYGYKIYPLVGSLPAFLKNRHRFLEWMSEVLGTCPTLTATFRRPGKIHGVMTANPANVEHMLKTNFDNFPKGPRFVSLLQDFLGKGIFNSDEHLWRLQRKTASYEFNTKSLRNFSMDHVSFEIASRLLPALARAAHSRAPLDLQDVLERFAFDNICKVAFGVDPGCLGGDATAGAHFMLAFEDAATLSSGRFMYVFQWVWKVKKLFNFGSERRLRQAIATVHDFADNIIRLRIHNKMKSSNEDLLSRFVQDDRNSPEFLRDIVISFILAGRDTTSSALTSFFWLLSSKLDVEGKILSELEIIRGRYGKSVGDTYSYEELRDMNYLQAAITEAMRLYPPVPVDTKECLNDDVFPDGTFVGKGWFATYIAYAMGRMESLWGEDCLEFKPGRWMDEKGMCRHESAFRYPIFHAGPRLCLGKDMAYIQMKAIAASVLERFRIGVEDKDMCREHILSLTLRMRGGLPVTVTNRSTDLSVQKS